MNAEVLIPLAAAAVQSGTPILYATLGEIITERAGVLNLGVEGMMIVGALSAFLTAQLTGSPWLALAAGGLGASLLSLVHAVVCLTFLGNQVVSGLALTILGLGLADFLGQPLVGTSAPGFYPFDFPVLSQLPVLGPIFFQHDVLVLLSYPAVALVWLFFRWTKPGLALDAVGMHPTAAKAAGLNPIALRYLAVIGGGFFAGLGGAYLSLASTHLWTVNLTAGRGWIAVALVIFAFWRPERAVLGAYLFGGVMAFQLRLQASGTNLPSSLLLMLPYLATLPALVISSSRVGKGGGPTPAALGVNLEPED